MNWRKGNRLPLVRESEASGQTASIYRDIKAAFGVEHVPMSFQAFAAHPRFLELLWHTVKPLLYTREFFQFAGRLRAEIYTRVHNYFSVPSLEHFSQSPRLLDTLEVIAYTDPLVFLLLAVQQQSFDGPVGAGGTPHPADRRTFPARLEPVDYDTAPPAIRKIYDDIRHVRDLSFVDSSDSALARFPQFFAAYWQGLKPVVQSPLYEPAQLTVREAAYSLVRELPLTIELEYARMADTRLSAAEIAAIVRVTELLVNTMSGTLLNMTFAKIAAEGGNRPHAAMPVVPVEPSHQPKTAA